MKAEWTLDKRDPAYIESIMPFYEWLYVNYFEAETSGWHRMPSKQALLVGSHNGGLAAPDLTMLVYDWFRRFGTDRPIYGLMHQEMWNLNPALAEPTQKLGAIPAHPKMAMKAIDEGASVLVFPGGARDVFRPFHLWDKVFLNNNKGFIKLAISMQVPIVPIVSAGAHHTLIVLADLGPLLNKLIKLGMPWPFGFNPEVLPIFLGPPMGVMVGPHINIPLPRKIYTKVCEPIYLYYEGERKGKEYRKYVDEAYEHVLTTMQAELDILIENSVYKKTSS